MGSLQIATTIACSWELKNTDASAMERTLGHERLDGR